MKRAFLLTQYARCDPTLSFPPACRRKASRLLAAFHCGQRNYRKLKNGYLKIDVGRFWRLLSRDCGQNWELMTHERYNTARRKS